MRKSAILLILFATLMAFQACNDEETYADKRDKERSAISKFIADSAINVISEQTFFDHDSMTDVSKNEYVLFNSSGVYMQIVRKGCGKKLQNGETATVLLRFRETNVLTDSLILSNISFATDWFPERMSVTNTSGTFSGTFDSNSSMMYSAYGSTAVPKGWLVPMAYINLGRPVNDDDQVAKVKLIVPASQGQATASANVIPCFYELTLEKK